MACSYSRRNSVVGLIALATIVGGVIVTAPTTSAEPRPTQVVATYKIGFEGPLSGPNAALGLAAHNGARLAVAQANAAANLPFNLGFTAADDQGDPTHAPAAASALIADPDVKGVVGPSFSGATIATGGMYQNAHLAFVTPTASNPTLSHNGWRVFHRVIPSDTIEGAFAADWLDRRGVQRMFVVQDRSTYGLTLGNATTHEARAKGVQVTYVAEDGVTTTNYRPLARRITSSGVHAIFYAGYDLGAARLAKALDRAGYSGLRVSGNAVRSSLFTNRAGAAGIGWYVTCGCMTTYVSPAQRAFAGAYRAMFHRRPSVFSAQGYDAANAIIRAITSAVAAGHTSRAAVNAALGDVDFHGVSTRVLFARNGDIARSAARVNLFQDRQQVFQEIGDIRGLAH